ncbi:hypothetical protein Rs2_45929 [Raphanus sativus]|nr:hypothetical protein Rs2_45929 [Raphanus sativus]
MAIIYRPLYKSEGSKSTTSPKSITAQDLLITFNMWRTVQQRHLLRKQSEEGESSCRVNAVKKRYVRLSDTGTSSHIPRQLGLNVREDVEDAGDNIIDEDEWHNFAISETPLTFPPTQKKGKDTDHVVPESSVQRRRSSTIKSRTILRSTCGIEIREPRANIPRAPPASVATDKGKNKRPIEYENDSDSDSDDAMVVPVLSTIIPASATADRPVARRLVFGVPEIPNLDGDDGSSSSSAEGPPEEVEEFGQHWGKFDEALHEMLNDPYTPALFGKDAPPCI